MTISANSTFTRQCWEGYLTTILIVIGFLLIIWFGMHSVVSAIRGWMGGNSILNKSLRIKGIEHYK